MDLVMVEDPTYLELTRIKSEIQSFKQSLKEVAPFYEFELTPSDDSFFGFIAKHIVFFKYLALTALTANDKFYLKILISDSYSLILSILENRVRYSYLNERSIIENFVLFTLYQLPTKCRISAPIMNEYRYKMNLTDSDYSLLKSEYRTACGYIHGNDEFTNYLATHWKECILRRNKNIGDRFQYYARLVKIFKILDRSLIRYRAEYVNGAFHRKKSLMCYLVGKPQVDTLRYLLSQ